MFEPSNSEEPIHPALAPFDSFNQQLQSRVHPQDWTNPEPSGRYNLVVVGGGTAGLVAAAGAAGLGAKVALVERHLLGGDCLNVGCVPSKALLRSGRAMADVRNAVEFGVQGVEGCRADFAQVMQRMRKVRAGLSTHDSASRFQTLGVDVFLGEAQFTGKHTLQVAQSVLEFSRACIATGARATAPPIPGLMEAGYLTNETIFSLTKLPKSLAVIGAGPLGCELAQAFARLGSEVHLIEAQHGIMPSEDAEAAELVKQSLLRDGVQVKCCGKSLSVDVGAVRKRLVVDSHGEHYEVYVDQILIGAGRNPNVENLGLDAAGVACDHSGVIVNDFLQTSNRHIYAAGDVCSRYKFTHAADAMARMVVQNALFFGRKRLSSLIMPWCTYTSPELAHVGLSPREAEKRDIAIDTLRIDFSSVDRAVLDGQDEGFIKVYVRKGKDRIVGATIVSQHAGEMVSEITLAMNARIGLSQLANVIHPYPTQAEAIRKAADAYNRTRLTPLVQKLFYTLMRWRR